jgi:hypothetical protein
MRTGQWLLLAAGMLGLTLVKPGDTPGQEAKAAAKPAPKAAPVAFGMGVNDAMVKQWEQRFGPQIRQVHRMELHFMRLVTGPTRQQYEKIAADSEPATKEALQKLVGAMVGRAADQSDPRTLIADAIAKSVRETLSPEQAARYQKELDLRAAAHKRLVVMNLVAMTDRVLVLRPDQREQLEKILADNWNESWNQTQMLTYGGQYFPQMPDAKINPILSDAQRAVWRAIPKANIRFGVNFGFVQGGQIEDEVWDDDPPKKKSERADEKARPPSPGAPKAGEKP